VSPYGSNGFCTGLFPPHFVTAILLLWITNVKADWAPGSLSCLGLAEMGRSVGEMRGTREEGGWQLFAKVGEALIGQSTETPLPKSCRIRSLRRRYLVRSDSITAFGKNRGLDRLLKRRSVALVAGLDDRVEKLALTQQLLLKVSVGRIRLK